MLRRNRISIQADYTTVQSQDAVLTRELSRVGMSSSGSDDDEGEDRQRGLVNELTRDSSKLSISRTSSSRGLILVLSFLKTLATSFINMTN